MRMIRMIAIAPKAPSHFIDAPRVERGQVFLRSSPSRGVHHRGTLATTVHSRLRLRATLPRASRGDEPHGSVSRDCFFRFWSCGFHEGIYTLHRKVKEAVMELREALDQIAEIRQHVA